MLLWAYGGYKVFICGDDGMARVIKDAYQPGGSREFDADFMSRVYEKPFEVVALPLDKTCLLYTSFAGEAKFSVRLCNHASVRADGAPSEIIGMPGTCSAYIAARTKLFERNGC